MDAICRQFNRTPKPRTGTSLKGKNWLINKKTGGMAPIMSVVERRRNAQEDSRRHEKGRETPVSTIGMKARFENSYATLMRREKIRGRKKSQKKDQLSLPTNGQTLCETSKPTIK